MFFERRGTLFLGKFSRLFRDPVIVHGFSTCKGGVSFSPYDSLNLGRNTDDEVVRVNKNWTQFCRAMSVLKENVALPQQVHGDRIIQVSHSGKYPETDGLVTNVSRIALVVQVADCLPIYLYDPVREAIGLLHAGWKGTRLKIASKAVEQMILFFETQPRDLWAFFGPSIGPCCYEVSADVIHQFSRKYITEGRLDLWQCNLDQLVDTGVLPERVEMSRLCTVCHPEWFFSHRASGGTTGRMVAMLGLRKKALDIEK